MSDSSCPECGEPLKDGVIHECTPPSSIIRPAYEDDQSLLDLGVGAKQKKVAQTCPGCSSPLVAGQPHECGSDPTIKSSPATPADSADRKDSPSDAVTSAMKTCKDCGERYQGVTHAKCPAAGTIIYNVPTTPFAHLAGLGSSRLSLEETPTKVRRLLDDPSKIVNQYVLVEMLGKGGMGTVWRAWDTKLTRWVALKFLTLDDEASVKRFEREAKLAARLRHPNIAAIYEVGEHEKRHYIAMELIDGRPLHKAELSMAQILEAIVKVAEGLHSAHETGVIHRDLKPENVMVTPQGWPYIMDFGLAKAVATDSSLSASGDVMGTPAFMSPEQAMGRVEELDARSDLYSLGATLYVLLTGHRPFEGETVVEVVMKVVNQEPPRPRKLNPRIPEPVEAILLKSMEKDPKRRYQTAAEFAADVHRYLAHEIVEARLPSFPTRVFRRVKRNPWPVAMGLVVVVGTIIAVVVTRDRSRAPSEKTGPTAAVGGNPKEKVDWLEKFRRVRKPLEFDEFIVGDNDLPERVRTELAKIEDSSSDDARSAGSWFQEQADLAKTKATVWSERPRSEWLGPEIQIGAARLKAWCGAAGGALQGSKGELAVVAERIPAIARLVEPILAYRGEFTLIVYVFPYAEVRILRNGAEVLRDATPLNKTLDVADYEVELTAPDQPPLKKSLTGMKNGRTYWIKGNMKKPESVSVSSAP